MKQKFLEHIAYMNTLSTTDFLPFVIEDQHVGYIHKENIIHLPKEVFLVINNSVVLNPELKTPEERTEVVRDVCKSLHEKGILKRRRGEPYMVSSYYGSSELMQMDREASKFFGIIGYGIHLNGIVTKLDGSKHMRIATRSFTKKSHPGKLDNMVAGGFTAGYSPTEILLKECGEEAKMDTELAKKAYAAGFISYNQAKPGNQMERTIVFIYDIDLPLDFVPTVNDGEVDHFELLPVEEVKRLVAETYNFKDNCNLIMMDWLVRNGVLTPEDEDYIAIVKGLR